MKQALRAFTLAVMAGTTAGGALAEEDGFYGGFSLGSLDPDLSDGTFRNTAGAPVSGRALSLDFDHASLIGFSGGYNRGPWAVELQYHRNLGDPDLRVGVTGEKGTFDYLDYRISGVYRSQGTLYFLGRAGLSVPELDTHLKGTRFRLGDAAFLGIGAGYRVRPNLSVELDVSKTRDDTGMFNVTLRHHF